MKNTNDRKSKQLGMPHGTAEHRLRRSILFHLLEKHNENVCFKCKLEIETSEEISIEHKLPWLDVNVQLFWDLDNIAFSHRKCNVPHNRRNGNPRKIGPLGHHWCTDCQDFLEEEKFYRSKAHWNGIDKQCKFHKKERRKRIEEKKRLDRV